MTHLPNTGKRITIAPFGGADGRQKGATSEEHHELELCHLVLTMAMGEQGQPRRRQIYLKKRQKFVV